MVIQANMPVSGIVMAWSETASVFIRFGIETDTEKSLEELLFGEQLKTLVSALNKEIGSSDLTCIEGG